MAYARDPDSNVILSSQFFTQIEASRGPEGRLMLAVLANAINSYVRNKTKESRKARRLFLETEVWFQSKEAWWLYSFENICDVLDINAGAVRKALFSDNSLSKRVQNRIVRGRCTQITEGGT